MSVIAWENGAHVTPETLVAQPFHLDLSLHRFSLA